jgi:ABC-type transporter Mla MlaB component
MPTMVISGAIADRDVPALCSQAARLLDAPGLQTLICDVRGLDRADATAVDGLARMQLTALRCGRRITLDRPSGELLDLIAFVGLSEVLPAVLRD